MGPFGLVLEALARLEYKLDLIIKFMCIPQSLIQPMHFVGQQCPVCTQAVQYNIDVVHGVVNRQCGCKSGKVTLQPMSPVPGDPSASPVHQPPQLRPGEDGYRREEG